MQAHRLLYSPNRPPRVAAATDVHRRCCQNCCQIAKLLSRVPASKRARILEFRTSSSTPIDARIRLYWRSDQTLLATLIQGPARARCGALGVEDPRGQRGELVDLIGAEMREEQPLQSSDVVVLRLLEFLDPFGSDRDFDTTTVVAGRAPDDQSPRLKFGHQP